jgi:hypothetical protein
MTVVATVANGVCHYLEYWKNKPLSQFSPDVTDYVCPSGWNYNMIAYHTSSSQTDDYARIKTDTTSYTGDIYLEMDSSSESLMLNGLGQFSYSFNWIVEAIGKHLLAFRSNIPSSVIPSSNKVILVFGTIWIK